MAPRSRTELKCSEERPVCAQCAKANRECIPSSGITFRHQQNPSMNAVHEGEGSLKSFYGYKETFGKNTTWVDVPNQLTFVHTSNPYEDAEDASGFGMDYAEGDTSFMIEQDNQHGENRGRNDYNLAQTAYPAYATQGLEALSAVASQDQYNYAPAPPPTNYHEYSSSQQPSIAAQHTHTAVSQQLDYILNPASARSVSPMPSNIDPHLHSEPASTIPSASNPEVQQRDLKHVSQKVGLE